MLNVISSYSLLLSDRSGVEAILLEMRRQMEDATKTQETQKESIKGFANAIRAHKNIVMLGMGASHCVNEIFSFQLRKIGIEAIAVTASEYLYDPFPLEDRLVLLTSQSGESVETVRCLNLLTKAILYGITLNADSTIGRNTRSLVAYGGSEKAFAGTRSVTLSLALMAYVSAELGVVSSDAVAAAIAFRQGDSTTMRKAVELLSSKSHIIGTGRSLYSGLAQLFCLGGEELGGRPIVFNETGQLRHGPLEVLSHDSVLVIFRQKGLLGELAASFENIHMRSGCHLVVIDSSGLAPLKEALTITCPPGDDIVAALAVMETFQTLMIGYACNVNRMAGIPKYSTKITVTE